MMSANRVYRDNKGRIHFATSKTGQPIERISFWKSRLLSDRWRINSARSNPMLGPQQRDGRVIKAVLFRPVRAGSRTENMPMHVRSHPRGRRIGPHVEPLAIQEAQGSRGALDGLHH